MGWQKTMAVNLQATALLCSKAVEHFKTTGGGIIINISSRAAFRGDTEKYLAYAASKGGVVSLTRSIARAYGKQNIIAFNIAPGFVKTDMANEFIDIYGENYVLDDIALPELTEPADLAPLVTLLASGLANHATGGTFDVNAGSYVH
jgi:NAD(P)-dependent dehydrogenase (short-subunit alcohol dehydrogenase family)